MEREPFENKELVANKNRDGIEDYKTFSFLKEQRDLNYQHFKLFMYLNVITVTTLDAVGCLQAVDTSI